jgi:hypothetical protein
METPLGSGVLQIADFPDGCISVGAWIFLDSVPSGQGEIIAIGYYGLRCLCFQINDGKVEFLLPDSMNNWHTLVSGSRTLTAGVWHHVAVTYDSNTAIAYVDGSEDSRRTLSFSVPSNYNKLYVGATMNSDFTPTNLLPGKIDELRVVDAVWTASEIASYYNSTK